jgi:hypothetical protein
MALRFDPKKLRMLSPDADDWYELVEQTYRNQENMIEGVLLYPAKGFSADRLEEYVSGWIEQNSNTGHGCLRIMQIKKRGNDWAIAYCVTAWYNHFDLNEES